MYRIPSERTVLDTAAKQLYIAGAVARRRRPAPPLDVQDPSTGETIAAVADASPEDALDALSAAHDAFASWRETAPRERGEILRRAYKAMIERADALALLMTLEMGKPLAESRAEVTYAAEFLRWYSEEAVRIDGRFTTHQAGSGRLLTMKQPVGPCVFITPWNFPLAMGTRKIGPALAAGCTMVVKPAKLTPLSMLALARILEQAGVPAGVLNVVSSSSSGSVMEPLIRDPRTRKLSFTGSTEVGRRLMEQASEQLLRVSMELGGNAPFVVFEDADLDAALDGAMIAKMRNIGEACTAANRFHVHESLATAFADGLAERMGALKIGRGIEEGVEVGPLIDADQLAKVQELVEDAVAARRARALRRLEASERPATSTGRRCSSTCPPTRGCCARRSSARRARCARSRRRSRRSRRPTTRSSASSRTSTRSDLARALRVSERLETGMVGLNQGLVSNAGAPFGGIKHSGFGREGGPEGIEEYLEIEVRRAADAVSAAQPPASTTS